MRGLVYKSTGSWYSVKTPSKEQFDCRIKGKFRLDGIKSTNPIAVGDYVDFEFCLLYTSPSPRDATLSRMPSSA